MAKRKKLHTKRGFSHEELRTDRFLEGSAKLVTYIRNRKERFIFGLVAVIVLISIGNRYFTGRGKGDAEAEFQITMAHQSLLNGDYENALSRYRAIVEEYGNSRQGRDAYYWIGEVNFNLGRYGEAIDSYKEFLLVSSDDDILSPSALGNLAACYEALEDWAKAATTYWKVYDEFPRSSLSAWACLNSGVCFEKIEEFERAEEMYRIVIDKYTNSDFARDATRNLTFLRGKLQARGLSPAE